MQAHIYFIYFRLSLKDKSSITVPWYKGLSVKNIWDKIKNEEELAKYFPDYKEGELPPRDFLIIIISSYNYDATEQLLQEERDLRSISTQEGKGNLVKILSGIKEIILNFKPQKSKYCQI